MSDRYDDDFEIPDELTDEILRELRGEKPPEPTLPDVTDQIQIPRRLVLSMLKNELDMIETLEEIIRVAISDPAIPLTEEEADLYSQVQAQVATRRMVNYISLATVKGLPSL